MKSSLIKIIGLTLTAFLFISASIDLANLFDYNNQTLPAYIDQNLDNTPSDNQMDDKVATLGRVLFYDKKLSSDNTVSCASCHKQEKAFGLAELQGTGVNGLSFRRPMRLVNLRYREPFEGFFWDERAATLEALATQPIQDHIEMGYSGQNGDPDINDLIQKLSGVDYYDELFTFAFGDDTITEDRIAKAIAQFLRSIQSYDSKFDTGYAAIGGDQSGTNMDLDFPNFTSDENEGKTLFITDPVLQAGERVSGGVGCFHCHRGPNFHFLIEKKNNGVITEINGDEVLNITKSPSLRDVFGPDGSLNGPLFHNGQATTFNELLDHYNMIKPNINLDIRIQILGSNLNLTQKEREQLEAFVKTLTSIDIYTNEKWSDPFDANGDIEIIDGSVNISSLYPENKLRIYPNPAADYIFFQGDPDKKYQVKIYTINGELARSVRADGSEKINISDFASGLYQIVIFSAEGKLIDKKKMVKID